jgi:hypothetical protein
VREFCLFRNQTGLVMGPESTGRLGCGVYGCEAGGGCAGSGFLFSLPALGTS